MARTTSAGSPGRAPSPSSASLPGAVVKSSSGSCTSALVVVDGPGRDPGPIAVGVLVVAQPAQLDVAERVGLVHVDQPLLVQLEHGQEADDDLEAVHQPVGEAAERYAADA